MAESESTITGSQTAIQCEVCGRENSAHSLYCVQCGSHLGSPCLNCATPVAPQAKFCSECGTAVASGLNPMADPEYVGFWARFSAQVIDLVVLSLVFGLLGFFLAFVPAVGGLLLTVASSAYLYKNFKNQTPGRMLLKMRVVDRDGQDISLLRGLLRETVGKFVSLLFFGLGFIWVAIDGKKQGWHDKIAGTFVVDNPYSGGPKFMRDFFKLGAKTEEDEDEEVADPANDDTAERDKDKNSEHVSSGDPQQTDATQNPVSEKQGKH